MKTIFSSFTIAFTLLLSGCLAHMDAKNAANNLNARAKIEGNPYRWVVIDLEGDTAKLEKQLAGEVGPSKVTDTKKEIILSRIHQLETQNGRATKPKLKEVRILSEPWHTWTKADLSGALKNRVFEAWVFDNDGKEVVYSVQHIPGTKDDEFLVKGPWGIHS